MKSFLSKLIKTPVTPLKSDEEQQSMDSSPINSNINNNQFNNNDEEGGDIKEKLNNSVFSHKSINDSDNDWIKPKNHSSSSSSSTSATKQSNKRTYHITSFEDVNIKRIELSKLVWAKHPSIGKLNDKQKNLFPGRICENGIRTLNTNTQVVIEFFNLPYTFPESSTKCVVDLKNIRSFNCPFKSKGSLLEYPNMWVTQNDDKYTWDIPTMDNLLAVGYTLVYILCYVYV